MPDNTISRPLDIYSSLLKGFEIVQGIANQASNRINKFWPIGGDLVSEAGCRMSLLDVIEGHRPSAHR